MRIYTTADRGKRYGHKSMKFAVAGPCREGIMKKAAVWRPKPAKREDMAKVTAKDLKEKNFEG